MKQVVESEPIIDRVTSIKAFNLDVVPYTCSRQREWINLENERIIATRQEALQKFITSCENDSLLEEKRIKAMQEMNRLAQTPKLFTVHTFSRGDNLRMSMEMLFLHILRQFVPFKYTSVKDFCAAYPEMSDRDEDELNRLWHCANWFDVSLLTLRPQNNKSHLMSLVPRLAEGSSARYVTGSGESRSTSDRVSIFRQEGAVLKVTRAPRKRTNFEKGKKEQPMSIGAASLQTQTHGYYVVDNNTTAPSSRHLTSKQSSGTGTRRKRTCKSSKTGECRKPVDMAMNNRGNISHPMEPNLRYTVGGTAETYELNHNPILQFDSVANDPRNPADSVVSASKIEDMARKVVEVARGKARLKMGMNVCLPIQMRRQVLMYHQQPIRRIRTSYQTQTQLLPKASKSC